MNYLRLIQICYLFIMLKKKYHSISESELVSKQMQIINIVKISIVGSSVFETTAVKHLVYVKNFSKNYKIANLKIALLTLQSNIFQ